MQPQDPYSDPGYIQAKNEANTAYQNYGTAAQNTLTMPDMLKKALDQKFASQQNPLYGMQENAAKDYFNSLDTGYQSVLPSNNNGMIFSPEAQQDQIAGKRNSLLAALSSVNQMIGGGFGGIQNVISEATKAYQAQEMAAKLKADSAANKLKQLMDEIDAKEKIRQFNESLKIEQQKANASSGSDISSLIAAVLASQGQGTQNTQTSKNVDLSQFEQNTPTSNKTSTYTSKPAGKTPSLWDTITGWLGATPSYEEQPNDFLSNYNIGPIKL